MDMPPTSSSVPFQQAGGNDQTPDKEVGKMPKSQGNPSYEMTRDDFQEEDEELAKYCRS
jgi:hypothetical protein